MMNSGFGEGWLAYGHALFYMEEHEQAMNCYLRASRILEAHFEPLLYIAVEYCFANNFKLAADFLTDATQVAGANALAKQLLMHALRLLVGANNASIRVPLLLTNNKMPSTIVRTVINNRIKRLNN
ncbi:hypothetical protein niasHS_001667 [Heterodera schachtii]|uniref:Uncharacterized protein n=1 Tax=Heterodera schachtii TaxID=97005 RepID=A0ABD2KBQ9_HETSC